VDTFLSLISSYVIKWFGDFNDSCSHNVLLKTAIFFEVTFLFMMIKNFLTSYVNQGEHKPVRNLHDIAMKYLKGDFIPDLIPILPLTFIFIDDYKFIKLLYVIKVTRVLNGFKFFDTHAIFQSLHFHS